MQAEEPECIREVVKQDTGSKLRRGILLWFLLQVPALAFCQNRIKPVRQNKFCLPEIAYSHGFYCNNRNQTGYVLFS